MSVRILGLGVDVVDLSQIAGILDRHGERFVDRVHLSITHERSYAATVAILEGDPL